MVDFTTYLPPGVYVEEDEHAFVNIVGLQPTVVALVGPAQGFLTNTETIVGLSESGVGFSQEGVDAATVVVTAIDGTVYVEDTDYTLTESDGIATEIARIDSGSGGNIGESETIRVSYRYTPDGYHDPQRFSDFDEVQAQYGVPLDAEGNIVSPLSFAAKFAFQNGARQLVLVATGVPSPAEFEAAYVKLTGITDVDIVVPIPDGIEGTDSVPGDTSDIGTDLAAALVASSEAGIFRVGILGFDQGVTRNPVTMAGEIDSSRVMLVYPNRLRYFHGQANMTLDVSGFYLAAAVAGRMAGMTVQTPLTKKQIFGFAGFPVSVSQTMTLTNKNIWSAGGVSVFEINRQGQLVARHGVTTDPTNIHTREISLGRARDRLITLMQETVEGAGLIGSWIDEDTPSRVKGVVSGVLEASILSNLIVGYDNLKARQLSSDPSVIEVKFRYRPAYPLNYIVISFSINTQTGETTILDQTLEG